MGWSAAFSCNSLFIVRGLTLQNRTREETVPFFRNELLACGHNVVFVSLWKFNAWRAHYELRESMGSGGGAS